MTVGAAIEKEGVAIKVGHDNKEKKGTTTSGGGEGEWQ